MARCVNHKFLLNCCNFLFLLCGTMLIISGFYLFTDTKRILLSRLLAATSDQLNSLPQPLFYYIAIGLAVAGLVAVLAAIAGFWASCLNTYCFLSMYFLTVVVLLLAESVVCLAITLWPHCLGISLDESKMVKAMQAFYGVPGKEQFTNAMDLAQQRFGCCGMSSDLNYDTSLWKLQGYGQREWTVPLTCCLLENSGARLAFLDPKPKNETQCQSVERNEYQHFRHTEPCLSYLDNWYREQYSTFLVASLVIALIEFCVLLCIILNCTKISRNALAKRGDSLLDMRSRTNKSRQSRHLVENIYEPEVELRAPGNNSVVGARLALSCGVGGSGLAINDDDFKGVYVQPRDLYKQRHNTTFKPCSGDYSASGRSYLV